MANRPALRLHLLMRDVLILIVERCRWIWLRFELARYKARAYDQLAEQAAGLRRALETHRRAQDDLLSRLGEREQQIQELRQECGGLHEQLTDSQSRAAETAQLAVFRRLQPVFVQLPTLRRAVQERADIRIADVLDIFSQVEAVLDDMGVETIGEAGSEMPYSTAYCRAVGRGAMSVAPGDPVRVRYVGFSKNGDVLVKAEVTPLEKR
jgi:DNA anti-recombination protein RmuC